MLSSELVRSALESAPDAMVIVDPQGGIVFSNQQVSTLFGYLPEELAGASVDALLPERFRGRHATHRERFQADGRMRPMGAGLDLFARRRDGTEFPVEISLSPVHDGARTLVAAAIRDVTDRKRIQTELILAREIANRAREEAERANLGKSRFLATASHDLRQPLQALALVNGALRRSVDDGLVLDALEQQQHAIDAMSRLLNALLDISKLESGAIKPEPTDFQVAALFDELREEFAGLAANKGLQLEVEKCDDQVHSDPSLVEQILRNLVANAIKYTREGYVRLRCLHEKSVCRLEVLDTGIGIPQDQIPYIYDEFYQVGVGRNTVREGHGLGLSIVHRLARLLRAELHVQSQVGKGSVFSLDLPYGHARAVHWREAAHPKAEAPVTNERTKHVLIVDDDPAVLNATSLLLRVEGFRVSTAPSLPEALGLARRNADIDLLVTDYHLTDTGTGSDVIAAVRGVLGPGLPTVLVTGDTSTAIKELHLDSHLRMISKPINADELMSLIGSLLAG